MCYIRYIELVYIELDTDITRFLKYKRNSQQVNKIYKTNFLKVICRGILLLKYRQVTLFFHLGDNPLYYLWMVIYIRQQHICVFTETRETYPDYTFAYRVCEMCHKPNRPKTISVVVESFWSV